MKKGVLLFVLISILSSCNNDDNTNSFETKLVGVWKLAEVLDDPGDGSGTFEKVDSEKTLEFRKDGIVTSNGMISTTSIESNRPSSLRYSVTESVIFSEGFSSMKFELIDSYLVLDGLCVEKCKSKYIKIQ